MAVAHKGAISFGLVHIPIQMYRTTRDTTISFNQLCKQTKQRIQYKKMCPNCKTEVKNSDIVKGYQYEKDKYVIMSNEEIENLKVEKDRTIHILHFTNLADIDNLFYEKNYYAIPETHAEKAYELLRKAMYTLDVVAIAKTVIGTKETLLALCPNHDQIIVKTLFYQEEITELPKQIQQPTLTKTEETMAQKLIASMRTPFDASAHHDEFQERLKEAIEQKINGNEIVQANKQDNSINSPIDLMQALQESIQAIKPVRKRKNVRH